MGWAHLEVLAQQANELRHLLLQHLDPKAELVVHPPPLFVAWLHPNMRTTVPGPRDSDPGVYYCGDGEWRMVAPAVERDPRTRTYRAVT